MQHSLARFVFPQVLTPRTKELAEMAFRIGVGSRDGLATDFQSARPLCGRCPDTRTSCSFLRTWCAHNMARSTSGEVNCFSSSAGWVRIPHGSLHWVVFPTTACKAVVFKEVGWRREVQFLHDPFNTARSSNGSGSRPLKPAESPAGRYSVQILYGSLFNKA